MVIPQERARMLVKQLVAHIHQDLGLDENEAVKLVSEAAYDYFDSYWAIREMTDSGEIGE